MKCNKTTNLKKGWNRYCTGFTFLSKIPLIGKNFKDDHFYGVYIGCICKEHDISYSKSGTKDKKEIDKIFKRKIFNKFIRVGKTAEQAKKKSKLAYRTVKLLGWTSWRTWESKWYPRYQSDDKKN